MKARLQKEELVSLLRTEGEDEMEGLFEKACSVRDQIFFGKVFLYGFVYFSTWCRNNCNFCYYRKSNDISRYRKSTKEILDLAVLLKNSGVHLIDLTMGEDEFYHAEDFTSVLEVTKQIKEKTGLPVMISPGVVDHRLTDQFYELGTDWYALYQETHNPALFQRLRADQDYRQRMSAKLYAKEKGMLIEEGILTGVGETVEDIADSILEMGRIGASQMRVMSFVPQKGSPMEEVESPGREMEFKIIAALRLAYPEVLIPASLDVDGIAGLRKRIGAGANVVTSIIPPKTGLMGVAQNKQDVDEGGRTVEEVTAILASMGMTAATPQEYIQCITSCR